MARDQRPDGSEPGLIKRSLNSPVSIVLSEKICCAPSSTFWVSNSKAKERNSGTIMVEVLRELQVQILSFSSKYVLQSATMAGEVQGD